MKFDFDKAIDPKLKKQQLEEGIVRAQENITLFSTEVQKQITLKAQLEVELAQLKVKHPDL